MANLVHIRLFRDPQQSGGSSSYEREIEAAVGEIGLPEISGVSGEVGEGFIRRETGPEIVAAIGSLVGRSSAILGLVSAWRERYKNAEVGIQLTVRSPKELGETLSALKGLKT